MVVIWFLRIEFPVDFAVDSALHSAAINAFVEDISRQQLDIFAFQ